MSFPLPLTPENVGIMLASGLIGAVSPAPPLVPANRQFFTFGDSRTQANSGDFPDTKTVNAQCYASWLLDGLDYKARFGRNCNFGVGGDTSTQALARIQAVVDCPAAVGVVLIGVNDGSDAAPTIANYIQIFSILKNAGKILIVPNELPFTAGNAGQQAAQIQRRDWLESPQRKIEYPNIIQVDTFRPCLKVGTTCEFKDGYAPDGLHPMSLGNSVIGRVIAAGMASLYAANTSDRNAPVSAADAYDATTNPGGCIVPGFMMTGTGGKVDNVANTGVPTGWNVSTTSAGGATVVCSKGLDSNGFDALILDITPSGAAGTRKVDVSALTNAVGDLNKLLAGDKVATTGRVKMSDPGPYGASMGVQVNGTYGGVAANLTCYNFAPTTVSARSNDLDLVMTSQVADVNAGWATGTSRIFGTIISASFAGDGPAFRVTISQAGLRKVAAT